MSTERLENYLARFTTSAEAHNAAYALLEQNRERPLPTDIQIVYEALNHHGNLLYANELWDSVGGDLDQLDESRRDFVKTTTAVAKANKWASSHTPPNQPHKFNEIFRRKLEELGYGYLQTSEITFPTG